MNEYIKNVCKIGQGPACCKYLVMGSGWECMKATPGGKATIDTNWAIHEHVAQGDNCEGVQNLNDQP